MDSDSATDTDGETLAAEFSAVTNDSTSGNDRSSGDSDSSSNSTGSQSQNSSRNDQNNDHDRPQNPSPYHPSWTSEELQRLRADYQTPAPVHNLTPTLGPGGGAELQSWVEALHHARTEKQQRLDYLEACYQQQQGRATDDFEVANNAPKTETVPGLAPTRQFSKTHTMNM